MIKKKYGFCVKKDPKFPERYIFMKNGKRLYTGSKSEMTEIHNATKRVIRKRAKRMKKADDDLFGFLK